MDPVPADAGEASRPESAPAAVGGGAGGHGADMGTAGAELAARRVVRDSEAPAVLYDSPGCWKCDEVREALERLGVPFRAVTVRGDPEARAALVAAMGEPPQVPMLVDGRRAVWDRRRILAYLTETYGGTATPEGQGYAEMPAFMGGTCALGEEGCAI